MKEFPSVIGGSTLFIETTQYKLFSEDKKYDGSMQITGHLGDVMKESANIAYSYAKSFMLSHNPNNDFLQKAHLHLHIPEVKIIRLEELNLDVVLIYCFFIVSYI